MIQLGFIKHLNNHLLSSQIIKTKYCNLNINTKYYLFYLIYLLVITVFAGKFQSNPNIPNQHITCWNYLQSG